MLGHEIHTNFCAVFVWEMQESQKKMASVKKCSEYANTSLWDYPFGLTMPGRSANTANPNDNYKFTGYERDDEAGLTLDYANARTYDPIIGRFLQVDPLFDDAMQVGLSPYNYSWNNPTNLTDPTGECPWCIGAIVGGLTDLGLQVATNLAEGNSAFSDINVKSILVSTTAGVASGGLSVLSKANKVSKLTQLATSEGGELVIDAGVSAGSQLINEGDIDAVDVLIDVAAGQVVGNNAGDIVETKFLNSPDGKALTRDLNRAERIAANSSRPGRQALVEDRANRLNSAVSRRTTATSISISGVASKMAEELKSMVVDEKENE